MFENILKISRVCPREYSENSFERKYLMLFEGFEKISRVGSREIFKEFEICEVKCEK